MEHNNKRITFKSLLQEAWHTISHAEAGLQKTIIALATRPGKMIREYIHGNRKQYQKPFPFLFITTTLFAILLYWFHFYDKKNIAANTLQDIHSRFIASVDYLESKFYSWLHIGLLPIYGFISKIIFRQLKYNWAEWMVVCCYIISFILLLLIPFQILNTIFDFNNTTDFYIQLIIILCYTNLVMTELVPGKQRLLVVLQTLLWCITVFILFLYTVQGIAWLIIAH